MKLNKNKRGISLIVLVITIIVMIILAVAIILSLNSSGIMEKANEATLKSDESNLKEAASVKLADYQLKKQMGELVNTNQTASEYVKEALKNDKMNTNGLAITPDGEILTGLTEIAVKFAEAGVEIGADMVGYTLNAVTTYPTSGRENTYDVETGKSTTLTRDENITWKYIGIDEKGEATIVGSVVSTSPKMELGGKGGYLNGPKELKDACEAMYSGNMGTARSITIGDVTRVLKYTGERGSYYNLETYDYAPLEKPLKISKIAKMINYNMGNFAAATPSSDKTIEEYESNYYYINKTSDEVKCNKAIQDVIYPSSENCDLTTDYWMASSCVYAHFGNNYADFRVNYVSGNIVRAYWVFSSDDRSYCNTYAIRPVVSLSSNVNMSYENGVVTLSE